MMSPDQYLALGQAIAFVLLGGYTAVKAKAAEKHAKPTGNGFADEVRFGLRDISNRVERIEKRFDDHLERSRNV